MKFFALIALLFLAACGTSTQAPPRMTEHPSELHDPTNKHLEASLRKYFKLVDAPPSTGYNFVRYDLNGDGRRDAVVLAKAPFGWWCEKNGCAMLIFKAHNDHFTLVNMVRPVRAPMTISPTKTNGWNDIIVRVSGRKNQRLKDVSLQHNGYSYPTIADNLPTYALSEFHAGLRIFD